MPTLDDLLSRLWDDYTHLNPHAQRVRNLLRERGETVVNDHIAFRTFDDPRIGINVLATAFEAHGYTPADSYTFPEKKLFARHYEHPDANRPRVFISELKTEGFSEELRRSVKQLVDQVPVDRTEAWDFPVAGRLWDLSYEQYQSLAEESEYAGWLAAMGFRANHFTVFVNALDTFESLEQLNEFLKTQGFKLNDAGGEIKGSAEVLLEQSSTRAEPVTVTFSDGEQKVPGCYYEFARRYAKADGQLFNGFVAKSADKIFQSTDRQ
ncbi:DUF1338 domain-containing protein [Phycisphaerales bacterium AB-hyl4]|uniref:2-oxoadipate dioxygenase/decarboxylase n=1 Tax=Natronomicrosphaera hydrolytica TaxID=3242702 RepID=A0ABV4U5A9_9BACT